MVVHSLLIDLNACDGCKACEVFCRRENNLPEGLWRMSIVTLDPEKVEAEALPHVATPSVDKRWGIPRKTFVRISCMHCDDPACIPVCPTEALMKRGDGIVTIDKEKCTGCRNCIQACPFAAPQFDREKGVADKCDLCASRLDKGLLPACVEHCKRGALIFKKVPEMSKYLEKEKIPIVVTRESELHRTSVLYGLGKPKK